MGCQAAHALVLSSLLWMIGGLRVETNNTVPCLHTTTGVAVHVFPSVRCPCILRYLVASHRMGRLDMLAVSSTSYAAWEAKNKSGTPSYEASISRIDFNTTSMMGVALNDRNVFRSGEYRLVLRVHANGTTCFRYQEVIFASMPRNCSRSDFRVVGGAPASAPKWLAQVWYPNGRPMCGGALVGPKHILTAGHCSIQPGSGLTVTLGAESLSHNQVKHRISNHRLHPRYEKRPASVVQDVALIELKRAIRGVKPAKMNRNPSIPSAGSMLRVVGFGRLAHRWAALPEQLMSVDVPVARTNSCDIYDRFNEAIQICAGHKNCDSCTGDSGGPLYAGNVLFGVTSYGKGCGEEWPAVYSRVSSVSEWVDSSIAESNRERRTFIIYLISASVLFATGSLYLISASIQKCVCEST